MRIIAANVEDTIVVIHIPKGVVNHTPRSRNCVLFIVRPRPVKRGAKPRIEVSHPASACQWRKKVGIIVATIAKPIEGFRVRL